MAGCRPSSTRASGPSCSSTIRSSSILSSACDRDQRDPLARLRDRDRSIGSPPPASNGLRPRERRELERPYDVAVGAARADRERRRPRSSRSRRPRRAARRARCRAGRSARHRSRTARSSDRCATRAIPGRSSRCRGSRRLARSRRGGSCGRDRRAPRARGCSRCRSTRRRTRRDDVRSRASAVPSSSTTHGSRVPSSFGHSRIPPLSSAVIAAVPSAVTASTVIVRAVRSLDHRARRGASRSSATRRAAPHRRSRPAPSRRAVTATGARRRATPDTASTTAATTNAAQLTSRDLRTPAAC